MGHWFACMLTGRHDYRVSSSDGAIFLLCAKCGRRSTGWQLSEPSRDASRDTEPREMRTAARMTRLSPAAGE